MSEFCKLYNCEYGQILVKHDEGDDGPEVRFYFMPPDLGVCSVAVNYSCTDAGFDKSEEYFKQIDEKQAIERVAQIIEDLTK